MSVEVFESIAEEIRKLKDEVSELRRIQLPLDYGTTFPTSPSTGRTYFRTDRGLAYYYDGTRWLTIDQFEQNLTWFAGITLPYTGAASNTTLLFASSRTDYGAVVTRVAAYAVVNTTNNGSNYWSMDIRYAGTTAYTFNTSAGAAGADQNFENAPNTVVSSPIYISQLRATSKTGTPGSLTVGATIWYRLIG